MKAAGKARVQQREAARNSTPRVATPEDALEQELYRTLGQIDWLEGRLSETPHDAALNTALSRERDRSTKIADQMMKKDVKQRQVILTGKHADLLDGVLVGVLRDLGVDPRDPRVREVVSRHLSRAMHGGGQPEETISQNHIAAEDQPVDF